MSYISRGTDIGDGGEITLDEEVAVSQLATLGAPLYHLRVNAAGDGLEYAAEDAGTGTVQSILGGLNINVDSTDTANPIVNLDVPVSATPPGNNYLLWIKVT